MEVVIGKLAGFCPGVAHTVKKATEQVMKHETVYCLGELVHNRQVVDDLEAKGMITVENIEDVPNGSKVIFRAHGVPKEIYDRAIAKGLDIIDLTCGRVRVIHDKVEKAKEMSFIIILGKKNHPEIIGTKSFAGENSFVIETEEDIIDAYMEYEKTNLGNVYVVSQTTFSSSYFDALAKEIETNFIEANIVIDKTICDATEKRQTEAKQMAKDFHTMLIIGGKNSANTKELVEIAQEHCQHVYHVQTVDDVKQISFDKEKKIGIMAGASTPENIIEDIKRELEK